jgi:hypothetical protein
MKTMESSEVDGIYVSQSTKLLKKSQSVKSYFIYKKDVFFWKLGQIIILTNISIGFYSACIICSLGIICQILKLFTTIIFDFVSKRHIKKM